MKTYLIIFALLFQSSLFAAEVNVYSARKEALIKPMLDRFTEQTGIDVNLVTGKADTLIKRLEVEGRNSPADLLLTVDVARLIRAKDLDLLQAVDSSQLLESIPSQYRDEDKQWFGLSLRSRVIVYAPDRVNASELSTYEDLADPRWKKRLCVRSSSNVYNQSLVSALIAHHGVAATEQWATGVVDNFARKPKGGDRDQIKAVAAAVCDIALVNTYYLAGMLESGQETEVNAAKAVKLFWPNQKDRGAHMNISGAAILKHARHRAEAQQLLEFLMSDAAQQWYADTNYEYPVKQDIEISSALASWGVFAADELKLGQLGKYNAEAIMLMDRAGWK